MVLAEYYSDIDKICISFKHTEEFDQILSILKNSKFTFKKKLGLWVGEVRHLFAIEEELLFWDELSFGDNSRDDLYAYAFGDYVPTRRRIRYDINTLKFPPLVKEQQEAINHVLQYDATILRADTGTGKSFMSTAAIVTRFQKGLASKAIFLTVPSVMYSMKKEFSKFSDYFKEAEVQVVLSGTKECFDPKAKVLIMSHDTFRIISAYWHKKVTKKTPSAPRTSHLPIEEWCGEGNECMLIVDECHKLKNRKSLRFKFVRAAIDKFSSRILMSGTLMPKGFDDSWAYATLTAPEIYYNMPFSEWTEDVYESDTTYSQYGIGAIKPDRKRFYADRLNKIIYSISKDVLNLPGEVEKDIIVPMGKKLTAIYQAITTAEFKKLIESPEGLTKQTVKQKLFYALACITDVSLLKDKVYESQEQALINNWNMPKDNPKIKYCDMIIKEELEEDKDTKFIIWAENPSVIDQLGEYYKEYNPICIHGQNTPKGREKFDWREEQVCEFSTKKKHRLLIANPATLGVGLNITAARVAIHWARPFDLEKVEQARGRTFRPGMKTVCHTYNLICANSYDVAIGENLREKKTLEGLFMGKKKYLTSADMKYLLTGNR